MESTCSSPLAGKQGNTDRPIQHRRSWARSWLPEIASSIISILGITAIAGILFVYNNQPVPNFFYGLTLNAIISLLATISKSLAALVVASAVGQLKWHWLSRDNSHLYDLQIFDDGSRGPLGAVRLAALVDLGSLALPGAVITICLIVIDPFAQQLLTYPTRFSNTNSSHAWVPQARNLTSEVVNTVNYSAILPDSPGLRTYLTGFWMPTVYHGIFSGPKELDAVCPTGDCTWPQFYSISWRPICWDVTSSISLGDCVFSFDPTAPSNTSSRSCNLSMNDAQPQPIYATRTASPFGDDFLTWIGGPRSLIFRNSFAPSNSVSMTTVEIGYNDDEIKNGADIVPHIQSATECRLDACVQQYSMSLSSGHLETRTLSTNPLSSGLDSYGIAQWSTSLPSLSMPGTSNVTFHVLSPIIQPLPNLVERFLSGNTTQTLVYHATDSSTNITKSSYFLTPYWASSDTLAFVLSNRGFEATMKDIASQLTYTAHNLSTYRIYGAVASVESFVHVRWAWLAFPVLVVLSGSLFLTVTVFQAATRYTRVPIWKSSILPILPVGFHPYQVGDDNAQKTSAIVLYPSIETTKNGKFRLRNQDLSALEAYAKTIRTVTEE